MTTRESTRGVRRRRRYRARHLLGIAAIVSVVATSGCAPTNDGIDTSDATRVLQSVDVSLSPAAAITSIASTAVFVDERTGLTTSSATTHAPEDVVGELPVRVTSYYRTSDAHGSDLSELDGYTGRVEIDLTIENLTVAPGNISYDAAGRSQVAAALVGTPISVAGSTLVTNVSPASVVVSSDDAGTNGVVSATPEGDAIVQWATILAPPQSEATATFRFVADVEDFELPEFTVGAQIGLHTDLTFEGVLASAFGASPSSELAMQQRAIELVADVNDVLNRAGSAISEVRRNLDETSRTLGVDAVRDLNISATDLSSRMSAVAEQLDQLQSDVEGSLTGAHSAMSAQLSQIVASMNGILGDTTAAAPPLAGGDGCQAVIRDGQPDGTIFSTLLHLSAQLDGYAQASAECRDLIVEELDSILGPSEPDAATCTGSASSSMTCALFESKQSVQMTLADLVETNERILGELNAFTAEAIDGALQEYVDSFTRNLAAIEVELSNLDGVEDALSALDGEAADTPNWGEVDESIGEILATIASLSTLHEDVNEMFGEIHTTAVESIAALDAETDSVRAQQHDLFVGLCALATENPELADDIERLRSVIVDTSCASELPEEETPGEGGPSDEGESEDETPGDEKTLDDRLNEQVAAWESVRDASDTEIDGSALNDLDASLESLAAHAERIRDAVGGSTTDLQEAIAKLRPLIVEARGHYEALEDRLDAAVDGQTGLAGDLHVAFANATADSNKAVADALEGQARVVSDRVNAGTDEIEEVYATTIDGLVRTSDAIVTGSRGQIEDQQEDLTEAEDAANDALDARAARAVQQIGESTTASTRDVEGASAALGDSLNRVILDLGNPDTSGTGILGAMAASSATSGTADFQLALASQYASGFASVRSADIEGIMLRQAQFEESLRLARSAPAFHLDVPAGATSQTIYSFRLGGGGR